jgi:hypothetical protein
MKGLTAKLISDNLGDVAVLRLYIFCGEILNY